MADAARRDAAPGDGAVVRASPGWRMTLALLARLPQPALSRAFGRLADIHVPRPLRAPVYRTFARAVNIDLTETELALDEYATLDEFFVRRLRADVHAAPRDPAVLACPVDAIVGQMGVVREGLALQAKGRSYSVGALLADPAEAARFEGGLYLTLYLSPRHYHRIHSPCDGEIPLARHVPGALLPVNQSAVLEVPDLFPRNERLVCRIEGPLGGVAVIAIGAYNVGRISAAFDPEWQRGARGVTNRRGARIETRRYDPPRPVRQGDEIMAFHLGSTLVLLVEAGVAAFMQQVRPGEEMRVGVAIARAPRSGAD